MVLEVTEGVRLQEAESPYLPQARQGFSGPIYHLRVTLSSSVMCVSVCMIVYARICVYGRGHTCYLERVPLMLVLV